MPTGESEVINKKTVHMGMFFSLGLQDIEVRFLPARIAYEYYLSGKHIDIEMLLLL